jgi:hypothetical protein
MIWQLDCPNLDEKNQFLEEFAQVHRQKRIFKLNYTNPINLSPLSHDFIK